MSHVFWDTVYIHDIQLLLDSLKIINSAAHWTGILQHFQGTVYTVKKNDETRVLYWRCERGWARPGAELSASCLCPCRTSDSQCDASACWSQPQSRTAACSADRSCLEFHRQPSSSPPTYNTRVYVDSNDCLLTCTLLVCYIHCNKRNFTAVYQCRRLLSRSCSANQSVTFTSSNPAIYNDDHRHMLHNAMN